MKLSSGKFNPRQWFNILWVALFLTYTVSFGIILWRFRVPGLLITDFQAFYATAQIAVSQGFSQVYNLQLQGQFQQALQSQSLHGLFQTAYATVPMPYLPAFILLFLPVAALGYFPGYVSWVLLNVLLLLLYIIRFTRALGSENGRDLVVKLLICLPVFSNLILGQVNVFLLIFMGEFLLASLQGKDRLSGVWLSLLLLKPQTLILILPALLIRKCYKTLSGFALGSAVIFLLSLILVGPRSLAGLGLLLLGYIHGLPTNSPEVMMNWRAVAMNLSNVLPALVAWIIALEGMALTVVVTLSMWRKPMVSTSPHFAYLLLGTFAGTLAVTWHAHNHMEMILIPLILYLYARKMLPWNIIYLWFLAPPVYLAIMFFITPQYAYGLFGLGSLTVNLILLIWTSRSLRKPRPVFQASGSETPVTQHP